MEEQCFYPPYPKLTLGSQTPSRHQRKTGVTSCHLQLSQKATLENNGGALFSWFKTGSRRRPGAADRRRVKSQKIAARHFTIFAQQRQFVTTYNQRAQVVIRNLYFTVSHQRSCNRSNMMNPIQHGDLSTADGGHSQKLGRHTHPQSNTG